MPIVGLNGSGEPVEHGFDQSFSGSALLKSIIAADKAISEEQAVVKVVKPGVAWSEYVAGALSTGLSLKDWMRKNTELTEEDIETTIANMRANAKDYGESFVQKITYLLTKPTYTLAQTQPAAVVVEKAVEKISEPVPAAPVAVEIKTAPVAQIAKSEPLTQPLISFEHPILKYFKK